MASLAQGIHETLDRLEADLLAIRPTEDVDDTLAAAVVDDRNSQSSAPRGRACSLEAYATASRCRAV
jgi:hypothetical protein